MFKKYFFYFCTLGVFCNSLCEAQTDSLYSREYPFIQYDTAARNESVAELQKSIDSKDVKLNYDTSHGYLRDVLKQLNIDPSSQVLVFSRTSLQNQFISPRRPRAIYFNDDTYVAWVQKGEALEIGSMDPTLGPVFFTLNQQEVSQPQFVNEAERCLRCHDSYSLTGGGTPRFLMGSGYHGKQGEMMFHEGRIITDNSTQLRLRWGGWFVTGTHGDQLHLGNLVVASAEDVQEQNLKKNGNVIDLSKYTNTEPYLTPYSDIVALLVLEHQVEAQNLISKINYWTQKALTEEQPLSVETKKLLDELYEDLVRSLFFVDAAAISSEIKGVSGYAEYFSALGPKDSKGRSLRELDLKTKVFKYPLSYLVYSKALANLHQLPRSYLQKRIKEVLSSADSELSFPHLSNNDKEAIREILQETLPELSP